ncbi:MAG: hypothetical protein CW338_10195, partial [Clostridiales bacterium]|nr:hypothetical protein [Clostridiales bacterium]
ETATFNVTGSQTEVGTSENSYELTFNGTAAESNYSVTENIGILEVMQAEMMITVTGEIVSKTYDGTEHTATEVTFSCDSDMYDESLITYEPRSQSSTDVITVTAIGYTVSDFSYGNENITVTFEVNDGSLEIVPKPVKLRTDSNEWNFETDEDGEPVVRSLPDVFFDEGEFYERDGAEYSAPAVISLPGEVKNEIIYSFKDDLAAGNYTVSVDEGMLSVVNATELIVTITGNKASVEYVMGLEQSVDGYTTVTEKDEDGERVKIVDNSVTIELAEGMEAVAKGIIAGTYPMNLTEEHFVVTAPYYDKVTVIIVDGELIITGDITVDIAGKIIWNDFGNEYDTRPDDVIVKTLADGEEAEYTAHAVINEDGGWEYVLKDLPRFNVETQTEIEYQIYIDEIPGYTTTYDGYDIINDLNRNRLTIDYTLYGELRDTFTRLYYYGQTYDVTSISITGYKPDQERVTGTMGLEDVYVEVKYTTEHYTLTILYLNAKTGEQMAEPYVNKKLEYCDTYSVESPYIAGYRADKTVVEGMMYAKDKTVTVLYSPDDTIIIDHFDVPRGIPNQSVTYGDCAE